MREPLKTRPNHNKKKKAFKCFGKYLHGLLSNRIFWCKQESILFLTDRQKLRPINFKQGNIYSVHIYLNNRKIMRRKEIQQADQHHINKQRTNNEQQKKYIHLIISDQQQISESQQ